MCVWFRILIVAVAFASAGCPGTSRWGSSRDPFGPKAACALPPEASKEEIVAYLNKNILAEEGQPGLRGWKSESARIKMHGFSVSASLQVEAPRNLRLRVNQPLSQTAMLDIGSNDEQFWVWSKDSDERVVLTCRHNEIQSTASNLELPLPVQPEWLMEVLGVIPLDPNEFRMERSQKGSPLVDLIADCHGPTGEPVQRRIQVNACHGIVTLHELRNFEGKTIAKASFSNHYRDPETKLILAKQVRLDLPQDKMVMELELNNIEVNPLTSADSVVWNVPQLPGHRMVDLAEVARSRGRGAFPQYADASEDFANPPRTPPASPADPNSLNAPAWPGQPAPPMGRPPVLSFEEEPDANGGAAMPAQFEQPGGQFEMPDSASPQINPAEPSFRGQSPGLSPPQQQTMGFWSRLKARFTSKPPAAAEPPEAYSSGASRSSWGPPRLGLE